MSVLISSYPFQQLSLPMIGSPHRVHQSLLFCCTLLLGGILFPPSLLGQTAATPSDSSTSTTDAPPHTAEADTSSLYEDPMPFSGWKVINLPTDRTLQAGNWLFLIGHRFIPPVGEGYSAFYGLDGPATIYLSMGYALTDDVLVALARSNVDDNVELETRYRIATEAHSGTPFGMAVQGSVNWLTRNRPGAGRWRGEAFKFTGQATFTRTVADQIGLAVVPGLTLNPSDRLSDEAPLITLGLGARWKLQEKVAVIGEWTPILSRSDRTVTGVNRFATWSAGLEITTEGHVFQLVASNNSGLTTDQYLNGGDLDIRNVLEGEFRLGFNIFRILDFSKF